MTLWCGKNSGSTAKSFYWLELQKYVYKYIISCTSCAISKPTMKKKWLYTPLPPPDRPWESISMDYMFNLTSTKHGNDCVFMVIDRFSKMAVLAPCKNDPKWIQEGLKIKVLGIKRKQCHFVWIIALISDI
jgi:hypothetical protein